MNYAKSSGSSKKQTPQSEPIPGSNQQKNNAGGFSFVLDIFKILRRFLILGSEGGTYYTGQQKLTKENAKNAIAAIQQDGVRVVREVMKVSDEGLAKSNDPAIFVLALVFGYGNKEAKTFAEENFSKVIRIGTHLFHFVSYVNELFGWNRQRRRVVSSWYNQMEDSRLEFQMVKYQSRDGWSHHDVMHMAHPKPNTPYKGLLFGWAKDKNIKGEPRPQGHLEGYIKAHKKDGDLVKIIEEHGLTFEMLPTEALTNVKVWEALLPNLGYTAILRNLGRMSSLGMTGAFSDVTKSVISTLTDREAVSKSRIHPLSLLIALKTYRMGRGIKGSLTWTPDPKISASIEEAFYLSFKNVEPTGKRVVLALDVSASMGGPNIAGVPISPAEASAVMAMVTARVEKDYEMVGFSHTLVPVNIGPKDSLVEVMRKISSITMGSTDCAQPMLWAIHNKIPDIGGFVVYTDNETWYGNIPPQQALKKYRDAFNPSARQVVVGMTATPFTIADPNDAGSMDVVGFDASAPAVISSFIRGDI